MLTHFPKKDYRDIAELYRLGTVTTITHFHKGYQTPKAALTTSKGTFVVSRNTLSNTQAIVVKSKRSLHYEIDLLNTLKQLPVPKYMASMNNNFIEPCADSYVTVYHYLPGNKPRSINRMRARELGQFLGSFHKQSVTFKRKVVGRRKFYDLTPRMMKKMKPFVYKQTHALLKGSVREVHEGVLNNRLPNSLPAGPIHVDVKPDNELFIGNRLTGVVDFGNFYIGPFIFDVGKTIMWNCYSHGTIDAGRQSAFLAGYESRRRLTREERSCLDQSILFAIYSHLWVDLYHIPLKYVPESYTVWLVKKFLPVARWLEKSRVD